MRESHGARLPFPVFARPVGGVTCFGEQPRQRIFRIKHLLSVDVIVSSSPLLVIVRVNAALMWQSPGQEARQRRSAPGSRQMAGRENGSLFGQPIPIRRPDHRVAHEPEMLVVLIIRNDEDDIRLLARSGLNRRPRLADEDQYTNGFEKNAWIHVKSS